MGPQPGSARLQLPVSPHPQAVSRSHLRSVSPDSDHLRRRGIANCHNSTGGIIENVFHALDISLWIRLILEGYRGIEDSFLTSLDLARSIQSGLCNLRLAEHCPAIGQVGEVRVVLQDQGFLGGEDLIQIVRTRPNPEMTMIVIPFLQVGITQVGFFLGNVLTEGRLIRDVGFARCLIEILGQDFEAGSTNPAGFFDLQASALSGV